MKYIIVCCFGCLAFNVIAQHHDAGAPHYVKTRYYLETVYVSGTARRTDTMTYEEFNEAQKPVVYNSYRNNRVSNSLISALGAKGQTLSMTEISAGATTGRQDYFYDGRGNVIESVQHHFYKTANGSIKETSADTIRQSFDKWGNKTSFDGRISRETRVYNKDHRLAESDFYMQRNGQAQKTVNVYKGGLLTQVLSYWYDEKLYHSINNQYNDKQQLTGVCDSTTDFYEETHYTYNQAGLKATEISDKTFRDKQTKTTAEYTYDSAGRLQMQRFHSNDRLLPALYPLSYLLKQPDYELTDTYAYDQYGNRLQITTQLNGEKARVFDFLMTYYR